LAIPVTVKGKPIEAHGATVLIWGATTPECCQRVRSTYGFADVPSVENMLEDLRMWATSCGATGSRRSEEGAAS
jgi:hypothetical protein